MRLFWGLAVVGSLILPAVVGDKPEHDEHDPSHSTDTDVCATGCSAASYVEPELDMDEYLRLVDAAAAGAWSEDNAALESLLFYGEAAARLTREHGTGGFASELLLSELDRSHATLSVRLVNASGVERVTLAPARIPLGEKQHLFPEHSSDVQVPEISGTVRRVGLNHLWTRL